MIVLAVFFAALGPTFHMIRLGELGSGVHALLIDAGIDGPWLLRPTWISQSAVSEPTQGPARSGPCESRASMLARSVV